VKASTVRTVLRASLADDVAVHVKCFRGSGLSDRARTTLRGTGADRELRHLLTARQHRLPAVEPLAIARSTKAGGPSLLVTRTVPGAVPFTFALPAAVQLAAGKLLRRCHDLGLSPPDLHPGNLVVAGNASVWLLDLTSLRQLGEVDQRERARALAFFCQGLDGGALDRDAREFLHGYLGRQRPTTELRHALKQAQNRLRLHALAAFARRSSRDCRHTEVRRGGRGEPHWYLHRTSDAASDARRQAAAAALAAAPPAPDKEGRRGAVWLVDDLAIKQRTAAQARHLFAAHYQCLYAGVPQPLPVALRLCRGVGLVFARRLPWPDLASELRQGPLPEAAARRSAAHLGTAVGRLHAHGLRHRDLKFENLVRDPVTGAVHIVDLEGVRQKRPSDLRGQGADLGRLLAAWRAGGEPGGTAAVRNFLRRYVRARRSLLQPPQLRRIVRVALERAGQWASAHRSS
jgi:tRNA A-37 threonylcarbamoyl transferase component Bud32